MNGSFRRLAVAAFVALTVPLAAQQDVPVERQHAPSRRRASRLRRYPSAPVRFETGEGQTIRVSVYARGFQNPWSMAWVSDDTMLVAERGGAIKIVRNGVVDPQPVLGAPVAVAHGLSGTDLALHPDFERNHFVYISYTKPLTAQPGGRAAGGWSRRWPCGRGRSARRRCAACRWCRRSGRSRSKCCCRRWRTRWWRPRCGSANDFGRGTCSLERQGVHRPEGHLRR